MAANDTTKIAELADINPDCGVKDKSLTTTVLSWNIHGASRKGMAKARKEMLKRVICDINPDVMLLQETKKSIKGFFKDTEIPKEDYNYKEAKVKKETRVIYKKSKFKKVTHKVNLNGVLEEIFPKQEATCTRSGTVPGRETIKNRICVVRLRHISTKREIIFISYHNIRKGGGKDAVKNMATKFCKIIASLHQSEKCYVIAGVDFNCSNFVKKPVKVPRYKETSRRKTKAKVDFYIVSKSTENWKVGGVKAFDLFPDDETPPFTLDHYKEALDHDPLLLSLSVKDDEDQESDEEKEESDEEEEENVEEEIKKKGTSKKMKKKNGKEQSDDKKEDVKKKGTKKKMKENEKKEEKVEEIKKVTNKKIKEENGKEQC